LLPFFVKKPSLLSDRPCLVSQKTIERKFFEQGRHSLDFLVLFYQEKSTGGKVKLIILIE
jgi:hypothetical protein